MRLIFFLKKHFSKHFLHGFLLSLIIVPSFVNKDSEAQIEKKSAKKYNISNEKNNAENNNQNQEKTDLTVKVIGNERLDERTVLSYVDIVGLQKNDIDAINSSLKKLYESDLFLSAQIYREGTEMLVEIKENPIISEIKFEGNKKIDDDVLTSEIRLKKRSIYTKDKLLADIKRINDIYIKSGRFLTKIDPKIITTDQNRVELIFEISEGTKAKINDIYFIGNNVFSKQELLDEITSKETVWYKFFTSSDSYDSDRIEFDKEKLRRFYNSRGYADFSVTSAIAQINRQKDKFFISFLLEEGIKYNFGKITIINKIKKFDETILEKAIQTKSGKVYNGDLVDKTIDEMIKIMSENGYAFADIEPVLKRNGENKTIDLDYVLQETPNVYINQIIISGNSRTMDEVIRRELRLREGDPYNITKINRSKQRINNLGFFDKVEFNTKRIGNSNLVDLEIAVVERKTGELNFGIGYSTVDRAVGNIGIRERNLMGTGQDLSFNVQKSALRFSNQLSYTRPYFMGREIETGVDLFSSETNQLNSVSFDNKSQGFTLRGGYVPREYLSHQLRYSYSDDTISNIGDGASESIKSLRGSYLSSLVGHTIGIDKRDNRLDPRRGYYANLSQDYAGLGGDIKYLKNEVSAGYYLPLINDDFIFKLSGRAGYIDGIGQGVRSNNNFYLGGYSFRGFEYAGIGPRAKVKDTGSPKGGDALGGNLYYLGTAELRFPIGLPKDLGINTSIFTDVGSLRMFDKPAGSSTEIVDTGSLRMSYGLSIIWNSPMGPLRLDFARIAKREYFDNIQTFRFNFGTSF